MSEYRFALIANLELKRQQKKDVNGVRLRSHSYWARPILCWIFPATGTDRFLLGQTLLELLRISYSRSSVGTERLGGRFRLLPSGSGPRKTEAEKAPDAAACLFLQRARWPEEALKAYLLERVLPGIQGEAVRRLLRAPRTPVPALQLVVRTQSLNIPRSDQIRVKLTLTETWIVQAVREVEVHVQARLRVGAHRQGAVGGPRLRSRARRRARAPPAHGLRHRAH
jgi:hypothetical protein